VRRWLDAIFDYRARRTEELLVTRTPAPRAAAG
jgi:hypothetical protein